MLSRLAVGCSLVLSTQSGAAVAAVQAAQPPLAELSEEVLLADGVARIDDDEESGTVALPAPPRRGLRGPTVAASLVDTTQALEREILDDNALVPNRTNFRKKVYPISHNLVGRVLDDMPDEIQNLASAQAQQGDRMRRLADSEKKGTDGVTKGAKLNREMAKLQANIFVEGRSLKKLKLQHEHLEDQGQSIDEKLRLVMGPRIKSHQKRLAREQKALEIADKEVQRWKDMHKKTKSHALALLRERKQRAKNLEAARKAVADAIQVEAKAQNSYEGAREETAQGIEEYKYAQTRLQATSADAEDVHTHEKDAEQSLARLANIEAFEEKKLTDAIKVSEKKVDKKIDLENAAKKKAVVALKAARAEYHAWEDSQKQQAAEVRGIQQEVGSNQTALDNARLHVLRTAGEKVGHNMDERSHWDSDDWAWSGGGEGVEDSKDALSDDV